MKMPETNEVDLHTHLQYNSFIFLLTFEESSHFNSLIFSSTTRNYLSKNKSLSNLVVT